MEQKRLLQRYGSTVFLDATYKTSLYDLPLFFMAVKTNVDYQVVGTFVTEDETMESISEALKVLQTNCPDFKPAYFMTDFDESEISAVESVFPGVTGLICDFHRNQAWERWTKKKQNSMGKASVIMEHLQKLANSSDVETFEASLETLKKSEVWEENSKLQNYIQRVWLPHKKRWSKAYRKGIIEIMAGTNNGIESHHNVFKRKYMHGKTTCNLSNMLKKLINDFFPSRYRLYVEKNKMFSGKFRQYSSEVPTALRSRPRHFIKHCLQSLESSKSIPKSQVNRQEDGSFTVTSDSKTLKGSLGDSTHMPSCDCNDWYKFHMPCKHMLAVITTGPDTQWHDISPLYLQSVYCIIDDLEDMSNAEECTNTQFHSEELENTAFEDSDKESEEHIEDNLNRCGVMARDAIKKLLNVTYNLTDGKKLKHIEKNVRQLIEEVQSTESVPLLPLPKRLTKKKYRRRLSALRKKKFDIKSAASVQPSTEPQSVEEEMTVETDMQFTMPEAANSQKVEEVSRTHQDSVIATELVNKLWSLNTDLNTPVAKPYGTVVTDTDIRSLKAGGWLTDNILDCYLNMLSTELREQVPKQNVLHFVTSLMSSIVSGVFKMSSTRGFRHKLSEYDTVTGIYGRSAHWTLIIVDITANTIYFYNPTGEHKEEMEIILANWKKFIEQYNAVSNDQISMDWTISSKPHTLQKDSYNCGVYCLLIAEKHLRNESGMDQITDDMLMRCRRHVAEKVVMFEDYITDSCPACGFGIEDDNMMVCGQCQRLFHFKHYCIGDSVEEMQDGDHHFICKLCKINFWPEIHPYVPREDLMQRTVRWTSKAEIVKQLQENKDADPDVVIIDNVLTSSPVFRRKELRQAPKQKRRISFVYPQLLKKKKTEKVYCVCKKTYKKGDSMWCCDACKEWYHPRCIGRNDQEQPPRRETSFLCEPCLSDVVKDWPVDGLNDLLPGQAEIDVEDDFFMKTEEVHKHIKAAYIRCWYLIRVEGMRGVLPWMKRHMEFIRQNGCLKSYGFGEAVFSQPAIFMIKINLYKRFQRKKDPKAIYSLHNVIPAIANERAKQFFQEESGQSENYIDSVLVKEAMIKIMQEVTGEDYTEVEEELKKTEARHITRANQLIMNYMMTGRLSSRKEES